MGDFKELVLKITAKIPRGKVLTYRQVAELTGQPRAWRAVGNILGKNFNPKIPCHRVIRADGKLGGYNRGIENKIKKLIQEGIVFKFSHLGPKKNKKGSGFK